MDFKNELQLENNTADNTTTRIVSEDPAYHSIKIYNMVRDRLWEQLDKSNNSKTFEELLKTINGLRLLLLRGDKIWLELKYAIQEQRANLKMTEETFPYKNELNDAAIRIQSMINIITNAKYISVEGSPAEIKIAIEYIILNNQQKISWIKNIVEKIILEADENWGKGAAKIHFTMPVDVKDTRDPFF